MPDTTASTLLERVKAILTARQDLSPREFGRRIGRPTPSWISEFFAGKRTTNDLRLVLRMARVLGVPAAYLLGEATPDQDAETLMLLSAFHDLKRPLNREAVLRLALTLRDGETPTPAESSEAPHDETSRGRNNLGGATKLPRGKRR